MVTEPKEPYPILRVEKIAEYLGADAGKIRTALTNIQDGAYCVEVFAGKWIRVISVPVERAGGMAWTPAVTVGDTRLDRPFPCVYPSDRFECKVPC